MLQRPAQMLMQGGNLLRVVIKGHLCLEDTIVAGLLDIPDYRIEEPEKVIIKTAANIDVPSLCQRLVLVVGTAVRKLRGRQIQDPLPDPAGDETDRPQAILV